MTVSEDPAEALLRLDALTRRLRIECPWDREQDERSIVPHTLEEAYELADAAHSGDDAKLLDELGDVLFQVHFLALLLEERGAGSLAQVVEHVHRKLVKRHPHVFSDTEVADAGEVLANWNEIKKGETGREPGIFGEVPENLAGLLYARKVQRRARTSGLALEPESLMAGAHALEDSHAADRDAAFVRVGDVLFAAVDAARRLEVDPEIALRAAADRFRGSVDAAERLGEESGSAWDDLSPHQRLQFYAQARQA